MNDNEIMIMIKIQIYVRRRQNVEQSRYAEFPRKYFKESANNHMELFAIVPITIFFYMCCYFPKIVLITVADTKVFTDTDKCTGYSNVITVCVIPL